jgi:sortase (surface protein transpeptidase)
VARSAPVTLRIPAIGLDVPVSELGLNPDGTIEVPASFTEPGWYRLGPSPGQAGSAVILGHVDSYLGPAVFFRLRSLLPGDLVEVTLADGVIVQFVVRSVAEYLKADFPDRLVHVRRGVRHRHPSLPV